MVDRRPFKPRVAGSIPATPTRQPRSRKSQFRRYDLCVDHTAGPEVEGAEVEGSTEPEAADLTGDLDQLAVIEAELAAAEAELEALDSSTDPSLAE